MTAHQKLDEIFEFLAAARSLPMSSSVVVNRSELTKLLDELRDDIPAELKAAQDVLRKQDSLLYEATVNAERLLDAATGERDRMVSEEEVVRVARVEAAEMLQAAREEADRMSRDVDGYVDAKLAHLEVSVNNILEAIRKGREHLSAASGLYSDLAADALPTDVPVDGRVDVARTDAGAADHAHRQPVVGAADRMPHVGGDENVAGGPQGISADGGRRPRAGGQPVAPVQPWTPAIPAALSAESSGHMASAAPTPSEPEMSPAVPEPEVLPSAHRDTTVPQGQPGTFGGEGYTEHSDEPGTAAA